MSMQIRSFGAAAVVASAALVSASAQAGVLTFTQQFVWQVYANSQGAAFAAENFNSLSDGFYASPLNGSAGPVNWTATSSGGLFVQSGQLSTNTATSLTFSFGPDVRAIGGNFYATDFDFNVIPSVVTVNLTNGTSYAATVNSSSAFIGFYGTDALITSLTISAAPTSGTAAVYPTMDNIQFGILPIPAPGALAVVAAGSALGLRRRRR